MATIAQTFYLGAGTDDGTYGTTVNQLVTTAPAANSATTNTWSSATVSTQTEIPLTASTTNSDTSSSNGWAFNNTTGGDALGSTATEQRFIPAGVWNFSMSYTLNSPALLATIACTVTANVYRVSSTGTTTLLFQAASANFSATGVRTWASASQPQYTLGANEVIIIGYTATSAATKATVLGAVTNTVLTLNLGSSTFVTLPSPGVRTLYTRSYSSTGKGTSSRGKYAYSEQVIQTRPVAYWRQDDTSGTTMVDAMGTYNGTYTGAPNLNQTSLLAQGGGTAIQYTTSSNYSTSASASSLSLTSGFTLEGWFKPIVAPAAGKVHYIVAKGNNPWYLYYNGAGQIIGGYYDTGAAFRYIATTTGYVSVGTTYYAAVTWDKSTIALYINGSLYGTVPNTTIPTTNALSVVVGYTTDATSSSAIIDEVAVYDYALGASQIAAHYNAASNQIQGVNVSTLSRNATGKGTVTASKVTAATKTFTATGKGIATHNKALTQPRNVTGKGSISYTRLSNLSKTFSLTGKGTVTRDQLLVILLSRTAIGVGSIAYSKVGTINKTFTVTGKGVITEVHPVQAYRTFDLAGKGVVDGRIELPISKVPTGTGSTPSASTIFAVLE